MTLREMAVVYRTNNEAMRQRIRDLRAAARNSRDEAERQQLRLRIAQLTPLYREGREIALVLERYYIRRRRGHGKS